MEEFKDLTNIVEEKGVNPVYDPKKKYGWEPNSNFLLTGEEFGIILNSLRLILAPREAQAILRADQASRIIENVLAKSVELGIAKEIPPQTGK